MASVSGVTTGETQRDVCADATGGYPALWDWRRRIASLYAEIRAEPNPITAWRHWRDTRDRLFLDHRQSPLDADVRERFRSLPFYVYDPALRFNVDLVPSNAPDLSLDAGADGSLSMRPFARTAGLLASLGQELTLYWLTGYCGGVFLPFADATSGSETYGGGRYLLDTIKSADLGSDAQGRLILDFTFSYTPSCSY